MLKWRVWFLATFFQYTNKEQIMRSILYVIAVIMIVGWALGVFYWNVGGIIHILIILAVVFLLFGLIRKA